VSRTRVLVLFGGKSVEREVSRISARTICGALDPARYDVIPLAVGNPASRPGRSFGDHDALLSSDAAARQAVERGVRTAEYVFHNPRPERAALEIARQRNVGLLVFAPDAERFGRRRHARAARRIRRGADCLVWPS